jgi:DNA polymerase-3 subunit gamma/tau
MDNNRKPLALRYRPQKFQELIGQDSMVISIQNAIKLKRIPNAYLLTGIRGTGKTTTARIIAKAINCKVDFASDQKCSEGDFCHCESITNSNHIDILEMDAASKTGIDDIREILEASKYHPSTAEYKVFIIDEVHMLSKQAFNALLKTLEEPPPHLKFILATTEVKKIPVTILSRCQRFDLRRIKVEEMKSFLKKICEKEEADVDENSLTLISKSSEGSVRDALSILDQAIITYNLMGEKVTEDKVRTMLGLADDTKIVDLMSYIVEGNIEKSINAVEEIFDIGADPKLVLHSLLDVCYLMTRTKTLGKISKDLSVSESDAERLNAMVKDLDMTYLTMLWHFLIKGLEDLNLYPNLSIAFQMLLTRLCHLKNMPDPQSVYESKEESKINTEYNKTSNQKINLQSTTQIKTAGWGRAEFKEANFRMVPNGVVRHGSYIAKNVVLMPSFVNVGAYVDEGTMIDTWASVGSCAQVGKNCHVSGGAGIGGVLEPMQANPTIIEDNCFIGARSEIVEGVIVGEGSVISMGVFIGQSTKIINRETGETIYGKIPPYSVVVPGSLPDKSGKGPSLYCAVIVKTVDEKTRSKTSINDLLRD